VGEVLDEHGDLPIYKVERFTEKPDTEVARAYCEGGLHLWNSGMVVTRLSVLRAEMERHLPAVHQVLAAIDLSAPTMAALKHQVRARFPSVPSVSFDYGVLERSDRIVTVPAAFAWDDVGDWAALGRLLPTDARGNAVSGPALLHDCSGLVVDSAGNRLVVGVGVDDLVIVDTATAILVCRKDRTQAVRHVSASAQSHKSAPG
jgi:mannose-1-phosphate guanylyltransferase